jgi:hypothetical protein
MRLALLIGAATSALMLSSCASTSGFIADNLPEWAGGEPRDVPPRQGAPGYRAYLRSIGDQGAGTVPAAATTAPPTTAPADAAPATAASAPAAPSQPTPPPRNAPTSFDQPIH